MGGRRRSVPDRDTPRDTSDSRPSKSSASGDSKPPPLPPSMSQRKSRRGGKKCRKKKRFMAMMNALDGMPAEEHPQVEEDDPSAGAAGRVSGSELGVVARHRQALITARHIISKQGTRLNGCDQYELSSLSSVFQSPFLWRLPRLAMSESDLYRMQDNLLYTATTWSTAVERIRLAVEFFRFGEEWKVRELLEEAYGLLDGEEARACDVMADFRPALKHVLDSSWLLVRHATDLKNRAPFPDGGAEADFVPYGALGPRQQAAVHGIRGLMDHGELKPAQLARKLDGAEGLWVMVEAVCLEQAAGKSTAITLPLFERAHAMRPNAMTAIMLGITRFQHGFEQGSNDSFRKCVELAKTCLKRYPQSAYVQLQCARLLQLVPWQFRDMRRSELAYRTAVHLACDWKKADLWFGKFLLKQGKPLLAMRHLSLASEVYESGFELLGMCLTLGLLL